MNSSTSSFRSELKVILVVVVLLACVEVGLRLIETRLSLDIANIKTFPGIASRLANSQEPTLLFFGNSMTRKGVDTEVIQEVFEQARRPVPLERSFADDTVMVDWYYIFKHFYSGEAAPDVMVVGFASDNLEDVPIRAEQPRRIGRYFSSLGDTPELFRYDLTTLGERTEYLLSRNLVSFANRERVRKRLLVEIIPNYQTFANDLNTQGLNTSEQAVGIVKQTVSYTRLERFINLASSQETKLVFVAMPNKAFYNLNPELVTVFKKHDVAFIDVREIPEITADKFEDNLHLTAEGATIYSSYLAAQLMKWLSQ
jgi:hypothetical protein